MEKKIVEPICEFCGNDLLQDPDDALWKLKDLQGVIHILCSYLCCLRYAEAEKRRKQ